MVVNNNTLPLFRNRWPVWYGYGAHKMWLWSWAWGRKMY